METLGIIDKLQRTVIKYCCEKCDYSTCRKSSYDKHILTIKHIKVANGNCFATSETNSCKKLQNTQIYSCELCKKEFLNRSGLWKHNKKGNCTVNQNITIIEKTDDKNDKLIEYLMKENKEIKEMILELIKNCTTNNK